MRQPAASASLSIWPIYTEPDTRIASSMASAFSSTLIAAWKSAPTHPISSALTMIAGRPSWAQDTATLLLPSRRHVLGLLFTNVIDDGHQGGGVQKGDHRESRQAQRHNDRNRQQHGNGRGSMGDILAAALAGKK